MSRSSDIDFSFEDPLNVSDVLHSLVSHGASLSRNGEISYVLDRDEMFDWQSVPAAELENVIAAEAKEDSSSTSFGISLFLDDQLTGGDLLFHPGRTALSFMVAINRRILPGSQRFCDFGWYLSRLIPVFENMGLKEFTASDYE